ncbi:MAG TPA: Yip1 family protein [Bacteroidales bacterium]|nr:Yip1 family protein [Bacteroidales bacterium]HPT21055.1 Yip1 family protein [Bacteroidales bacterium]
MNYNFFLSGIKNIFQSSDKTWETIESENRPVKFIEVHLLFPLIILVAVSATIGSMVFVNTELSPLYSVFTGIKCFCLFYLSIYFTSLVFGEITKALDLGKDFSKSFKIITYSVVPLLLCQILSRLLESLLFVNVLALYGLYIFWAGVERLLNPPEHKKTPMMIATFVSFVAVYVVSDLVLTKFINLIFNTFFD